MARKEYTDNVALNLLRIGPKQEAKRPTTFPPEEVERQPVEVACMGRTHPGSGTPDKK